MPITAKGANVFRASQGSHTHAISPELEDNEASDDEGKTAEQTAIPWSPSPPPNACHSSTRDQHSPTSPVFASGQKHKYSALSAAQTLASASPHSTPSTSSWHKRARKEITGPAALQGLRAELSTFGQTFVKVSTPPPPTHALSPS